MPRATPPPERQPHRPRVAQMVVTANPMRPPPSRDPARAAAPWTRPSPCSSCCRSSSRNRRARRRVHVVFRRRAGGDAALTAYEGGETARGRDARHVPRRQRPRGVVRRVGVGLGVGVPGVLGCSSSRIASTAAAVEGPVRACAEARTRFEISPRLYSLLNGSNDSPRRALPQYFSGAGAAPRGLSAQESGVRGNAVAARGPA